MSKSTDATQLSSEQRSDPVHRLEMIISTLLRIGVVSSVVTIVLGTVVMFAHHPAYLYSPAELERLTNPGAAFPHTVAEVVDELTHWRGRAIVTLGLLMLIVTPVMRVAVSIPLFLLQRDRMFAVITLAVLILLVTAFVLGKAE